MRAALRDYSRVAPEAGNRLQSREVSSTNAPVQHSSGRGAAGLQARIHL